MVRYYIFDTMDETFNFARYFRFNHSDGYYCSRTSSELPETTGQLPELTNELHFCVEAISRTVQIKCNFSGRWGCDSAITKLHYITKPMINTDWSTEYTNVVSQYMQDYNWYIPQYTLVHTSQSRHFQNICIFLESDEKCQSLTWLATSIHERFVRQTLSLNVLSNVFISAKHEGAIISVILGGNMRGVSM